MKKSKKGERTALHRKVNAILWAAFVICVVAAIALWFPFHNANPEFEAVKAKVVSAETTRVRNTKTGFTTDFYKVEVEYQNKIYNLENVHNTYSYPKGKIVTAYLSNERLFADQESVKIGTPAATAYYIFLIGSFGFLFAACIYGSKRPKSESID